MTLPYQDARSADLVGQRASLRRVRLQDSTFRGITWSKEASVLKGLCRLAP